MALTTTEEAQLRALLVKQTELLSLAASEPAIISELGAGDTTFPELTPATVINDADLLLVRQGTEEKSALSSVFAQYVLAENAVTQATNNSSTKVATTAFANPGSLLAASGYQKLPSGLIIQWGVTVTGTSVPVTFPIAFTTNTYLVNVFDGGYLAGTSFGSESITTTGFIARCSSAAEGMSWLAIGK